MSKNALSRRQFLKIAGGGIIVAASSATLTGCGQMPAEAVAAWQGPDSGTADFRKVILAYALLAPNAHNIQPWLVDLQEPDAVTLFVDTTRLLPQTDPFARQILISQGCFLELMRLAALSLGYQMSIDYFPEGVFNPEAVDGRAVACCRFVAVPQLASDPLFDSVLARRSNKSPFQNTALCADHARALPSVIAGMPDMRTQIVSDSASVAFLQQLTAAAMRVEIQTPRTHRESVELTRIGQREISAHRDGIDLHGPMIGLASALGILTREKSLQPGTFAYRAGLDYALGWAGSTPTFGWLTSRDNSRISQVRSGQAYLRLNLQATALGVAMHPVSQLLQEYPEMQALQQDFMTVTDVQDAEQVQMLFRLGYADPVTPSPRRELAALLLPGDHEGA